MASRGTHSPFFKESGRASFLSVLGKTLQRYNHRNLPVQEFILEMFWSESESDDELVGRVLEKILFKGLKRLSLNNVHIKDETTLEKIMRSCPLIEYLFVSGCTGFTMTIPLTIFQAEFLDELHLIGCRLIVPTTQLLLIEHLKTLSLDSVYIKEETLEKIMCGCPLIERLLLCNCVGLRNIQLMKIIFGYGLLLIQEIKLTVCSIKRLVLIVNSIKPTRATIYAPNIQYFKFFGHYPPQIIFNSETAVGEWKSHLEVWSSSKQSDNKDLNLSWFIQLSELLNSLRESQISLVVDSDPFKSLKVEDTNDVIFCKHVPLEHVHVKGGYESCSFPDLLNCLFLICRPRYIGIRWITNTTATELKKEKDKLFEFIIFKTIQNKGEMSRAYLWGRDLEEITMHVCDERSQGWHTVGVEETSFPGFTISYSDPAIRFSVKWRD